MGDYNILLEPYANVYGRYCEIFGMLFYPGPDGGIAFRTIKMGKDLERRSDTKTIKHGGDFAINKRRDRASLGMYKIKPKNSPRENTHRGLLSFRQSDGFLKINGTNVCELVGIGYIVEVPTEELATRYSWTALESRDILEDFRKLHRAGESAAAA